MDEQFKRADSSSELTEVDEEHENPNEIRIGIIADVEVTLGFLLAGVGYTKGNFCNYMMVKKDTSQEELETFFHALYVRPNIGIILVDYASSKRLQVQMSKCKKLLPVIVVIPTKDTILMYLDKKEKNRRLQEREEI